MGRSEMIKYALIVLLVLILVFIFMRLYSSNVDTESPNTTGTTGTLGAEDEIQVPGISTEGAISSTTGGSVGPQAMEQSATLQETFEVNNEATTQGNTGPVVTSEVVGFSDNGGFGDVLASVPASENSPEVNFKTCDLNKVSPEQLLPTNDNTEFSKLNPSIEKQNFLDAGAHIGLDTIGQSLRNANYQLRADPPNPQNNVSPWMNSTIQPDPERKSLC